MGRLSATARAERLLKEIIPKIPDGSIHHETNDTAFTLVEQNNELFKVSVKRMSPQHQQIFKEARGI